MFSRSFSPGQNQLQKRLANIYILVEFVPSKKILSLWKKGRIASTRQEATSPTGAFLKCLVIDRNQNNSSSNTLTPHPQTQEGFLFIEPFCSTLKFILKIPYWEWNDAVWALLSNIPGKKKWKRMMKHERQNDNSG